MASIYAAPFFYIFPSVEMTELHLIWMHFIKNDAQNVCLFVLNMDRDYSSDWMKEIFHYRIMSVVLGADGSGPDHG